MEELLNERCRRTKKVDMTPIRLEGDEDEDGEIENDEEDHDEDDDESTPVPRSKRRAAACVSILVACSLLGHLPCATSHFLSVNLLETASSRGLRKRRKGMTTMTSTTKRQIMHQSQLTQFWVLNRKGRKLMRWMGC